MKIRFVIICAVILLASEAGFAQTKYVSDEFEIMLRTGQSGRHEILRQIKSGTPLTVLEQGGNYTKVRLGSGVEGWVLTRYLSNQPSGRDRLATLEKRYDDLKQRFDQKVEQEKQSLHKEITRLERIAKKPLELQRENANLKAQLEEEKQLYVELQKESEVLKSPYKDRQWFVTGALVVLGSMLVGIILTRIPWQRRKRWNQL